MQASVRSEISVIRVLIVLYLFFVEFFANKNVGAKCSDAKIRKNSAIRKQALHKKCDSQPDILRLPSVFALKSKIASAVSPFTRHHWCLSTRAALLFSTAPLTIL
jgi:hypothetical protein